jgi:8-amino-7-oxononanoate synthase
LIVDEAHSIGVIGKEGKGLVAELKLQGSVFAVVYTYGKAMGTHGGLVAGSHELKQFLVNFSRPFIYTTAPSFHQAQSVRLAYSLLTSPVFEKQKLSLRKNILFFTETMQQEFPEMEIIPSHINKLIIGDIDKTVRTAKLLREFGFICRPVLSPTVETGRERIRINLHAFNTIEEIEKLIDKFKTLVNHA